MKQVGFYGAAAAIAISSALVWKHNDAHNRVEMSKNFKLNYAKPAGWVDLPKSPQTLFSYEDPKTNIRLRGAANQVVCEVNPTPELDRDGLTNQFAELTRDNLGWKATILDTIDFSGGSYRLIRRETVDRTIMSAIAVKGNTTVLITLAAQGKSRTHLDDEVGLFRKFLASTSLTLTHID